MLLLETYPAAKLSSLTVTQLQRNDSSCILHPPGLHIFLAAGFKNSLLHCNLMRCLKCGFNHSIKVTVIAFKLVSANIFPEQTALPHP